MDKYIPKIGIGQDSHRFLEEGATKPCIIGGCIFKDIPGLSADSDGDVIYHAICNAISSITTISILGGIAKDLCHKEGITDSKVYLEKALVTLKNIKITHISITIEAKRPKLQNRIDEMRKNIADVMKLDISSIGITATSGDGLTDFGCAEGIQAFCILSAIST